MPQPFRPIQPSKKASKSCDKDTVGQIGWLNDSGRLAEKLNNKGILVELGPIQTYSFSNQFFQKRYEQITFGHVHNLLRLMFWVYMGGDIPSSVREMPIPIGFLMCYGAIIASGELPKFLWRRKIFGC